MAGKITPIKIPMGRVVTNMLVYEGLEATAMGTTVCMHFSTSSEVVTRASMVIVTGIIAKVVTFCATWGASFRRRGRTIIAAVSSCVRTTPLGASSFLAAVGRTSGTRTSRAARAVKVIRRGGAIPFISHAQFLIEHPFQFDLSPSDVFGFDRGKFVQIDDKIAIFIEFPHVAAAIIESAVRVFLRFLIAPLATFPL